MINLKKGKAMTICFDYVYDEWIGSTTKDFSLYRRQQRLHRKRVTLNHLGTREKLSLKNIYIKHM